MDRALYEAVDRFADRTSWAHGLMRFYAKDGIVLFAVLLLVGWWLGRTSNSPVAKVSAAVWAGAGALLALVINQPIGAAIDRARPYNAIPNMHLLVDKTTDFSFPSDHATIAGAAAAGLWLVNRRLGIIATVAAVAMAFARVYVGAHYPGDVLAGLVLGAVVVLGLYKFAAMALRPITTALARSPLRTLITSEPRTVSVTNPA